MHSRRSKFRQILDLGSASLLRRTGCHQRTGSSRKLTSKYILTTNVQLFVCVDWVYKSTKPSHKVLRWILNRSNWAMMVRYARPNYSLFLRKKSKCLTPTQSTSPSRSNTMNQPGHAKITPDSNLTSDKSTKSTPKGSNWICSTPSMSLIWISRRFLLTMMLTSVL